MGNILVSVVIPMYNVEKYLRECLNSVLSQTISNIEIICVDDGSSDKSVDICKEYIKKDNRVKLLTQKNSGPSKARNRGIEEATGKWISFVDADDWLENNMLERLISVSEDSDIVISNYYINMSNSKEKVNIKLDENKQIWDKERINIELRKFLCKGIKEYNPYLAIGAPWARIYKLSLIKEHNIIFPLNVRRTEDGIFNMHMFENAKKIIYLNEPLYHYRLLTDSLSHKMSSDIIKYTEADVEEVKKFARTYKQHDEMFINGIDVRICTWFYKYLAYYFFTKQYLDEFGYLNARKNIIKLLNNHYYKDAFMNVQMKLMRNTEKLFVITMKYKLIEIAFAMVKARIWVKKIRKK
ncbi:MAG: glycosyltransferase [Lachnospiraceae bacterium]|nr:glycosyltransferase [Lachnospiraceae bacterium]